MWLALSELMPTRIRSNGMSVALVINQMVSTTLAAIFLPVVGKYGYSRMFFLFSGFTRGVPARRCRSFFRKRRARLWRRLRRILKPRRLLHPECAAQ